MGMFTSIIHPVDGRELQIKCGHDSCETYHVGDGVGQYVIEGWPGEGYLLDDVYDSYDDDWVIIKDGIVVAVEPRDPFDGEDEYLPISRYDIATNKKISTDPLPPKPSQYQLLWEAREEAKEYIKSEKEAEHG